MDAEAIQDIFQDLGAIRIRKMFGGKGVYLGDTIFAIEIAGELFLKADDENLPHFRKAGSRPFIFQKDGKAVAMSYWLIPGEAFDDPSEGARWGRLALEAAHRAAAAKKAKAGGRRRA
jgi:DNA transformation protein